MVEDHNIREERHHNKYVVKRHHLRSGDEENWSSDEYLAGVGEDDKDEHPFQEMPRKEVLLGNWFALRQHNKAVANYLPDVEILQAGVIGCSRA